MAKYTKTAWHAGRLITRNDMEKIEDQFEMITPGATNVAENYKSSETYSKGDYCLYDGELWKCIATPIGTDEERKPKENSVYWTKTKIMNETNSGISQSIANEYKENQNYEIGDYVTYNTDLYRCIETTHGAWDSQKWELVILSNDITDLISVQNQQPDNDVNKIWIKKTGDSEVTLLTKDEIEENYCKTDTIAPTFSESDTYTVGEYVYYDGVLYCFTVAHTAGAWIGTDATVAVIGRDVSALKSAVNILTGAKNQINFIIAYGETVAKNVFIKAGSRLNITGGANTNGPKLTITYADGTADATIVIRTGMNYRTQKDIVKLSFYNSDNTTYTYTCTIFTNELKLTNYFDKSTKISGYISGDSIQSGYYHSDFIPVALGDTIIATADPTTFGNARVWFYDENKTYKGHISGTQRDDGLYTFTLPISTIGSNWTIGDIYYAAFNTTELGSETAKFYINEVPELPLEYRQIQPNFELFFNAQQKTYIDAKETVAEDYSDEQLAQIVTHVVSNNKFNPNSTQTELNTFWQKGKVTLSNYVTSNPVSVHVGDVILCNLPTSSMYNNFGAYCQADKTYISMINSSNSTITDEGYVRHVAARDGYISMNTRSNVLQSTMIVINVPMPEMYEQYKNEYNFTDQVNVGSISGNESVLKGKRIAYNGDSICESRLQETTAYNGGAYAKIIADVVGGTYENRAISGGILASAPGDGGSTPSRCVVSDVTNMTGDADLICFEGGINDYWRDVPLGDYSESDYSGTLDTTTVCGALESIFRQATTKWVGKPIVFVIVHKIKSTVYATNSVGYTFAQEREKMIGICNKYAIPYYDAYAESGLNAYNNIQNTNFLTSNSTGNPDGCHPNEAAYRRYYVPQLIALFESVMPRLAE